MAPIMAGLKQTVSKILGHSREWYLLATEAVGKRATSKHPQRLRHFRKPLPIRHDLGTNRQLSVNPGVGHVVDEGLHRDDIAGDLLLELFEASVWKALDLVLPYLPHRSWRPS